MYWDLSAKLSFICGNTVQLICSYLLQGVKVSLSSAPCSSIPSIDSVVLQLVWTLEELQQQLTTIDEQDTRLRTSALAALKSGDKKLALRNARQLKLASESREKVTSFSNRIEEVLHAIADAESAKKVSEAIQLGAWAVKENKMEVEDLMSFVSESTSYAALEDEDVGEELDKLESQIRNENLMVSASKTKEDTISNAKASVTPDSLCSAMVDLKLESETENPCIQSSGTLRNHTSCKLEAA
ncbi:Charged multivesicular body protein 7 [Bienertia sinuspersici]